MRYSTGYSLRKIADETFLIAYGNKFAKLQKVFCINDMMAFIWESVEKEMPVESIVKDCLDRFDIDEEDRLKADGWIRSYIEILFNKEIATKVPDFEDNIGSTELSIEFTEETTSKVIEIAKIGMILNAPEECVHKYFESFTLEGKKDFENGEINIYCKHIGTVKEKPQNCIIESELLCIAEGEGFYSLYFGENTFVKSTLLSKNGDSVIIYYSGDPNDTLREEIFQTIKVCFFYKALQKGLLAVHSASILYRDKAWLFSGPSGAGKSTHTRLWKKILNTDLINGDVNLVDVSEGSPRVYGIPWCGTSEIFSNKEYPLGGIFLLKKSEDNEVSELKKSDKVLKILHRSFSPVWTSKQLHDCLSIIENISEKVYIASLRCRKDEGAVYAVKKIIDEQ